ncbi:zeta toxin family protein [Desulfosarcina sp. OttesenSCG-928-A07]|nr:zeta toxin family protein [Desulfosarcina sp. OttesenSCG-928-G17]MDL2328482.1 zeta toxin family protein [Desulfosarcina sp. OttesenSCG-928-A07]
MDFNDTKYRLSEAENQRIFDLRIKPRLFANAQKQEHPVAVVFGGQPGSGKSAAVNAAVSELTGCVKIEGDDFRQFHPQYDLLMAQNDKTMAAFTGYDAGRWVEKAIAEAKSQRTHVVIEGTMRNADVVAQTMKGFRDDGYAVDARALAVSFEMSELGIFQRYEEQKADRGSGRMTPPEAHKAGYDGMLVTLDRIETEKLADRLTIYKRGNVKIYQNELSNGQWIRKPEARAVVEAERNRPMSKQEQKTYIEGCEKVMGLMKARKASISERLAFSSLKGLNDKNHGQTDRDDDLGR